MITETIKLSWTGGTLGKGAVSNDNGSAVFAIPTNLKGSGEGFSPKEYMMAAAATCMFTSLVYLVASRKLPVTDIAMESTIIKDDQGAFSIVHKPKLKVVEGASENEWAMISRAIDSADRVCEIGKILRAGGVQITVEKS